MTTNISLPGFSAENAIGRASQSYRFPASHDHSSHRGAAIPSLQYATCELENDVPSESHSTTGFVFALGKIEPRIPTMGVEKEFAQMGIRFESGVPIDWQTFYDIVKRNRYLARQLCWVFSISSVSTYVLQPRDPFDLDLLTGALRRDRSPTDMDLVIGVRGPIAPAEMCNGLTVPIVLFDKIRSFDMNLLPGRPKGAAIYPDNLLKEITELTANTGSTDEHRALNFLVVQQVVQPPQQESGSEILTVYSMHERNTTSGYWLRTSEVRRSRLSGNRRILDPIFMYEKTGATDTNDTKGSMFARVDVHDEFPFIITPLGPYFSR